MVNNSRPYQRRKQVCFINFLFNTYSNGWVRVTTFDCFISCQLRVGQLIPIIFQGSRRPKPVEAGFFSPIHLLQLPKAMAKDRKFDSSHGANGLTGTGTNSSSESGDLVNVSSGTSGSRPMLRKRSSCNLVSLPNQDAEGEKRLHQSPGSPISALERFDKFWQRWDFWGGWVGW